VNKDCVIIKEKYSLVKRKYLLSNIFRKREEIVMNILALVVVNPFLCNGKRY